MFRRRLCDRGKHISLKFHHFLPGPACVQLTFSLLCPLLEVPVPYGLSLAFLTLVFCTHSSVICLPWNISATLIRESWVVHITSVLSTYLKKVVYGQPLFSRKALRTHLYPPESLSHGPPSLCHILFSLAGSPLFLASPWLPHFAFPQFPARGRGKDEKQKYKGEKFNYENWRIPLLGPRSPTVFPGQAWDPGKWVGAATQTDSEGLRTKEVTVR